MLGQTPDGEPLHLEHLPEGKIRVALDTTMVPLDQTLSLLQRVRAEQDQAAEASK
ncbi:hypothetical protein [Streptomyces sp.]|uniref:hypothetical protein n=1 Tax=Streptomyces sp. TaxID=1931 RepID=UPI002D794E3B|nr:hypothetical protein [Streptomyces sp.]HET6354572.1 hypothetical protein [Streptomyces sp.]